MGIKISKSIRSKLPQDQADKAEQILWDKSNGRCFLCEEQMNRASDDIEADHDIPESEAGDTSFENLNLTHVSCNRAKQAAKTIPIRPYLKLVAYVKKMGGRVKYDGVLDHFQITPKPVVVSRAGDVLTFELPDKSKAQVAVFEEENKVGTFRYAFVSLPQNAIFNDDAVQPRALRLDHVWSIYSDIQVNPLHEPPSCRLEEEIYDKPVRLLLFDGQHKTVANWMMGRTRVVAKVYLDMTQAQANLLVNSIQAKIKKLPLSPVELVAKMSDEWRNKFAEYEAEVGAGEVSESGFLKWVAQSDRTRAKQALQSAWVQTVLASEDLRLLNHVKRAGMPAPEVSLTEQALKSKVVEKLLHTEPLPLKGGEELQAVRDREVANIVLCLNMLTDLAFEPAADATELTEIEKERARRMTYQSSLAFIATLIRELWDHIVIKSKQPMSHELDETQLQQLRDGIHRLVAHPVWTADFDRDAKMREVKVAFEKNQGVPQALEAVGLDLSYLVLGEKSGAYKAYWLADH
ncbi:HNH endonuclease [Mycobacterium paragordonae]|uniref:HNH endonuclease n=1 Tax=Mycobacterium paragordonae TaxID=1389713 RepID=UPI0012E1B928|nr:HNH endonuclease signature motif containing protein [Mycobacterium paragordonae]